MKSQYISSSFFICIVFFFISFNSISQDNNYIKAIEDTLTLNELFERSKSDTVSNIDKLQYINAYLKRVEEMDDSLKIKGLMRKTTILGELKRYDKAIINSMELLDLSIKNMDSSKIGSAYKKIARYSKSNDELSIAFDYYNRAFFLYKERKDSLAAGKTLLSMANIQKSTGDFVGSQSTAIDALPFVKATNDIKTLSGIYLIISTSNRELEDFQEALKYNDSAITYAENAVTSKKMKAVDLLKIRNTRANILADQEKYKKAINLFSNLLKDSVLIRDKKEYSRVLDNLGYRLWKENKDNIKSESLLLEALKIREIEEDFPGLIASNIHLTQYYFDLDKEKSLRYADRAYIIAKSRSGYTSIKEALGFIFDLKENTNEEAKVYHETDLKLNKINQENKKIYAVTKYENEEIQKEVLRLEVDRANQELILTKERTQKVGYLLGLVIALLIIGFGTYYYRQRTRRLNEKTKYLEQQNKIEKLEAAFETEARLSRKVHDDFSGNIYQAMMLVENKTDTTEALDVLEGVYNQSRDFSREINEVDTGENFELKLFGMLQAYLLPEAKLYTKGLDKVHWQNIGRLEKMTIHKILQELMINMQKYSGAKRVTFVFTEDETELRIIYTDNGQGATEEALNVKNGLQITEKRIQDVGGTIIFETEKRNGFKATLEIPK